MPLKLWLVRHGETEINAGNWSNNPAETQLTPLGREQAKAAATLVTEQPDLFITSPLVRAIDSAAFLLQRWPQTPSTVWPIQEFIYLSPTQMQNLNPVQRKELIAVYWQKSDPFYCDGQDAESFASFLSRVDYFHAQLAKLQGFVVVIGHGQFFKAYQLGLSHGFTPNSEWMKLFRQQEVAHSMKNSAILQLYFD